jgi:tetratricopeptide (TPR) repeat protein
VASVRSPTEVRLHAKLANVLWRTGRREQAGDAFKAALRLAGAADPLTRAHLHTRLGRLEFGEHRFAAAAGNFDAVEALLGDDPAGQGDETADQWLEMMLDGRADMYAGHFEPDRALAVLEAARPVLEARGTPPRRYTFARVFTLQLLIRRRLRVDEADIEPLRQSLAAAHDILDDKDVGYATYFLGWVLWARGSLAEARERQQTALAIAERIGEIHLRAMSLSQLALIALREHRADEVRSLLPQAIAAIVRSSGTYADTMACQAWLAWQDGHPEDVIRLAAEIAVLGPGQHGFSAHLRWIYLWPLIAARLSSGEVADTAAAIEAARQLLGPAQQWLPDELTDRVAAACATWDQGDTSAAGERLAAALSLARDLRYC